MNGRHYSRGGAPQPTRHVRRPPGPRARFAAIAATRCAVSRRLVLAESSHRRRANCAMLSRSGRPMRTIAQPRSQPSARRARRGRVKAPVAVGVRRLRRTPAARLTSPEPQIRPLVDRLVRRAWFPRRAGPVESPTRCPYDNEGRSAPAVATRPSVAPPRLEGQRGGGRRRGCSHVRPQRFNAPPRTGEVCHSEWTSRAG